MVLATVPVTSRAVDWSAIEPLIAGYLWADEKKHYECEPVDDHIFLSAKVADELTRRAADRFELHDRQIR